MMGTIVGLELRQRLHGAAWWVLLLIWVVIIGGVTFATWRAAVVAEIPLSTDLFSYIIYFVLLMALLVTPALAGGSINGDRQDGVLATTQVTLVSAAQIVWGKFFAALIVSLIFLLAVSPLMAFAAIEGDVHWSIVVISLAVVLAEMATVCAIGVGLSGLIAKPLFSVVITYLLVALFAIGSLIGFGLATTLTTTTKDVSVIYPVDTWDGEGTPSCAPPVIEERTIPHTEYTWWALAANPFVVVADATPTQLNSFGYPEDLFGQIRYGVRTLQIPTDLPDSENWCVAWDSDRYLDDGPDVEEVLATTIPSWFVGLGIHAAVGLVVMLGAVRRTRTPLAKLPKSQRIA